MKPFTTGAAMDFYGVTVKTPGASLLPTVIT